MYRQERKEEEKKNQRKDRQIEISKYYLYHLRKVKVLDDTQKTVQVDKRTRRKFSTETSDTEVAARM